MKITDMTLAQKAEVLTSLINHIQVEHGHKGELSEFEINGLNQGWLAAYQIKMVLGGGNAAHCALRMEIEGLQEMLEIDATL